MEKFLLLIQSQSQKMSQKCQNFWQNWPNKNLAGAKKFSAQKF